MSRQLSAANAILDFFIEQIEGTYADVYFDSSVTVQPLVLEVAARTYQALTFQWSGTERLELCDLWLGVDADRLAQIKGDAFTSNTELFSLDGAASHLHADAAPQADTDLPFWAKVPFPQQRLTRLSLERFARFQPLATNLRIILETDKGETVVVYDKFAREAALRKSMAPQAQKVKAPRVFKLIMPALLDCMNIRLDATRRTFSHIRRKLSEDFFADFGLSLNKKMLSKRHLEFGQHGVSHSFRYWNDTEKKSIVDSYSVLVKAYKKAGFDTVCCFGFLLGLVREGDLISHDDDIDLLVFNYDTKVSNLHIMTLISGIAAQAGFTVIKISFNHRFARLKTKNNMDLDIFICNVEDNKCFVHPSRSPHTHKDTIFPIKRRLVFNKNLPFPHNPEALLSDIYGDDWRVPTPYFLHNWV